MVLVGRLPKVPTPDAFRRALGKLRASSRDLTDAGVLTDNEIAAFVQTVRTALDRWPSGVPTTYLEVVHTAHGSGDMDANTEDLAMLRLRGNRFEALVDDGNLPGDGDVVGVFDYEADAKYRDDLEAAHWKRDTAPGEAIVYRIDDPFGDSVDVEADVPGWARALANKVVRAYADATPVTEADWEHGGENEFETRFIKGLGRHVGLNADWSSRAWLLEGGASNASQGAYYLIDDDGAGWTVVQRWYPEDQVAAPDEGFPDDVAEALAEARGGDVIVDILGPMSAEELWRWAQEQPVEAHTDPRPNPRAPKGTPTDTNLFAMHQFFGDATERPNKVEAVDAPHLRRCIAAGLIAADRSTLRLTDAGVNALEAYRAARARTNPDDDECEHDGHCIECGPPPDDDEVRINPVSEAEMQSLVAHLSSEAITEAHRCLSVYGLAHLLDDGRVEVLFSRGGFSTMGRCSFKRDTGRVRITLNSLAWPRVAQDERLGTIRHECAHAIDYLQRGTSDHGPKWKAIAKRLGDDAERISDAVDLRSGLPIGQALRAELQPHHQPRAAGAVVTAWRVGDDVEFTHQTRGVIRGRVKSINRKTVTLDNGWRVSPSLLARATRRNPDDGRAFYVDGEGPWTCEEMCASNSEHPEVCADFRAMQPGDVLEVGGGAAATFVIECREAPRANPGVVVCNEHGWRHAAGERCAKCVDDERAAARGNPDGDDDNFSPTSHTDTGYCEKHDAVFPHGAWCPYCEREAPPPRPNPSKTRVQALVFDADAFTKSSAQKWASTHGFDAKSVTARDNTIRIRQTDAASFDGASFQTMTLAKGVQAIVGVPR